MNSKYKRLAILKEKNLCPVCKKHHFSCSNSYEICPICGWEDDLIQRKDPEFRGGANKMSLNEARKAFNEKK